MLAYPKTLVALAACALTTFVHAASLDASTRHEVVGGVVKAISENYRLPEQATLIAQDLLAREARGEYAKYDGADLAKQLTTDMQAISHDLHMSVTYRDKPRAGAAPTSANDERRINWGVRQADILDGNIGYLRVDQFADVVAGGGAMTAAMQFLSNTDALIIDLRQNRGGGAMLLLLASYFFDGESEVLQTIHFPRKGESIPYSTQSWVPGARYLNKPVYVLTAKRTFSAGEAFAYAMQSFKRATIVGETTRGAANPNTFVLAHPNFSVSVPIGETIGATTKTNWEGKGVQPDVATSEEQSLPKAIELAKAGSGRPMHQK